MATVTPAMDRNESLSGPLAFHTPLESKKKKVEARFTRHHLNLDDAYKHRLSQMPNWGAEEEYEPYSVWKFPMAWLNKYGIGTYLFFNFTFQLALLFCFLSVLWVPAFYLLVQANQLEVNSAESFAEMLSLGALGDGSLGGDVTKTWTVKDPFGWYEQISFSKKLDNSGMSFIFAMTDGACVFIMVLFINIVAIRQKRKAKVEADKLTTAADFTVRVEGLPREDLDRQEFSRFIKEQFGDVIDVAVHYTDIDLVKDYVVKGQALRGLDRQRTLIKRADEKGQAKKVAKLKKKLNNLQEKLKTASDTLLEHEDIVLAYKAAVCAYITFNTQESVSQALDSWQHRGICTKIGCSKGQVAYWEETHPLKIMQAVEPSNIMYDNLKYRKKDRRFRIFGVNIVTLVVLSICLAVISGASVYGAGVKAELAAMTEAGEEIPIEKRLLGMAPSITIVIVNALLGILIYWLVGKEKHELKSSYEKAIFIKMFVGLAFNTALVILLVNTDLKYFLGPPAEKLTFLVGTHRDITPLWYVEVGNAVIVTLAINIVSPNVAPLIGIYLSKWYLSSAAKHSVTQDELNHGFEAEEFELASRYAPQMAMVFACLFYSAAMPICYIIAMLSSIVVYWVQKLAFLRLYKIPPMYDEALAQAACRLFSFCIRVHCLLSIWLHGAAEREPESLNGSMLNPPAFVDSIFVALGIPQYQERLLNFNTLPFWALLLFETAVQVVRILWQIVHTEKWEEQEGILSYEQAYAAGEEFESYLLSQQPPYKMAYGRGVLPDEKGLRAKHLEKAKKDYKIQLQKEMAMEMMEDGADYDAAGGASRVDPRFWNTKEVGQWLAQRKSSEDYQYAFIVKGITGQMLLNMSKEYLIDEIGIENADHAEKIMENIQKLRVKAGVMTPEEMRAKRRRDKLVEKEKRRLKNYYENLLLYERFYKFALEHEYKIYNPEADHAEVQAYLHEEWAKVHLMPDNENFGQHTQKRGHAPRPLAKHGRLMTEINNPWTDILEVQVCSAKGIDVVEPNSKIYAEIHFGRNTFRTNATTLAGGPFESKWSDKAYLFLNRTRENYVLKVAIMKQSDGSGPDVSLGNLYIVEGALVKHKENKTWQESHDLLHADISEEEQLNNSIAKDVVGKVTMGFKLLPRKGVAGGRVLDEGLWDFIIRRYDNDDSKSMDREEMFHMLQELGVHFGDSEYQSWFETVDYNDNGEIDIGELHEFLELSEFTCANYTSNFIMGYLAEDEHIPRQGVMTSFHDHIHAKEKWGRHHISVRDRGTGLAVNERVPTYLNTALQLMYSSWVGRKLTKGAHGILKKMSKREGKYYDKPASKREIKGFIEKYNIDMTQFEPSDPDAYATFNDFFARHIKEGARPIQSPDDDRVIVSSADCRVACFTNVEEATRVWIKGDNFTIGRMMGSKSVAKKLHGGSFCIFRLAPQDYHRWHWPVGGVVKKITEVSGTLYSVNAMAVNSNIDIYGENKRVVVQLNTDMYGTVVMVAIGATMVGSYKLFASEDKALEVGHTVRKGDVAGEWRFGGSTVVLLFPKGPLKWDDDLLGTMSDANDNDPMEMLIKAGQRIGFWDAATGDDEKEIEA